MLTQINLILGLLFCAITQCLSNSITVDAHAEECFSHKVETGTKMGLTFDVCEGGFLDIDVRIFGPDGKNIYEAERETAGNYTFSAHAPGVYTYCFSNKMYTFTPKVVMFDMAIGEAPSKQEEANSLPDLDRDP